MQQRGLRVAQQRWEGGVGWEVVAGTQGCAPLLLCRWGLRVEWARRSVQGVRQQHLLARTGTTMCVTTQRAAGVATALGMPAGVCDWGGFPFWVGLPYSFGRASRCYDRAEFLFVSSPCSFGCAGRLRTTPFFLLDEARSTSMHHASGLPPATASRPHARPCAACTALFAPFFAPFFL